MKHFVRLGEDFAEWKRSLGQPQTKIPLRQDVVESWKRSSDAGVNPETPALPVARVPESELQARLHRSAELVEVAIPHLDWVSASMGAVRHVTCVTDRDGIILYSLGNLYPIMDELGLCPGYDWNEASIGTNGIGTALKTGACTAIMGPEHFHRRLEDWVSVGAPIRVGETSVAGTVSFHFLLEEVDTRYVCGITYLAHVIEQQALYRVQLRESARREEDLRKAKIDAEVANYATKESVARACHDLRTPVSAIVGFCRILRSGKLKGPHEHAVDRIHANSLHLQELVESILDISKLESECRQLRLSYVAVEGIVSEVTTQLKEAYPDKAHLRLTSEIPGRLHPVRTDRLKLKQILLNLVGNAIKFTIEGGVTVRIVADDAMRPVEVAVSDTGPGIPSESLEAIFQPFTRLGEESGSGLGLAICRTLCAALGYDLRVSSELGKGSTFRVLFNDAPGWKNGPPAAAVRKDALF